MFFTAPPPADEDERLRSLRAYDILDTEAEAAFDEIAELARQVCGTPVALVTLVDAKRQWFKSHLSFTPHETTRDVAFCAYAILTPDVMVVPDATRDPRFAGNPLVTGDPHIRFYAGAPLITQRGHAIGTVAVLDYAPRQLDDAKRSALAMLARRAVDQLELRRRVARAFDDNEAQKDALLAASLDCVIVIDSAGRIVEFNPSAEQTLGFTRAAVVGRPLVDVMVPPSLRAAHRKGFARYIATGEERIMNRRTETVALRADGVEVPVELTIARLGRSEPRKFVGVLRDVSERKRVEAAIAQDVERFQLVARATNDVVWDWDIANNRLWWGDGFQTRFGYPPAQVEPGLESWTTRLHPDDHDRVKAGFHRLIEQHEQYWTDEYRFRRHDGSFAEILDRGYVIRNADGAPIRVVGAMMDVTARNLAQEQIRQSEERYRDLFEDVGEAIFALSTDGVIASLNRAAEAMLGGPRGSWIGLAFGPLVHAEERDSALTRFTQVLRGEAPPTFEVRLTPTPGREAHVELTLTPRRAGGQLVGILGIGRDIAERKRLEEQLRQSQKMEALGQLSGGVAHDFNNLLTVIQCGAELLHETRDPSELKERVADIQEAAERGARLTRQLLVASRRQAMRPTAVDLNAVARDLVKMLARIVGEDITVRSEYAPSLPIISADAGMLEQVLLNLVVNARDAMPRGGRLTITTRAAVLDAATAKRHPEAVVGPFVCLSVRDTGDGIPPAALPRIFEAFFTTKAVGKGSGLGLATVYGIVKQHGGWVEVESSVGVGTSFAVYLPILQPTTAPTKGDAARRVGSRGGSETILLVEDDRTVRGLAARVLAREGYEVLEAPSGVDALEVWKLHRDRIDLLVTDLVMPGGMTGRELADRLRGDRATLKVIYASGYSADFAGPAAGLIEGSNFLQKPYRPDRLAELVRDCLDRPSAARE